MTERPILFSGPMVRAILEDRKTQTRRIVKQRPLAVWGSGITTQDPEHFSAHVRLAGRSDDLWIRCPYGKPGERLWVREAWQFHGVHPGPQIAYRATHEGSAIDLWRPGIHLRRHHSRITVEITSVRIERLHDITPEDALAEGVFCPEAGYAQNGPRAPVLMYAALWEDINGFGHWELNPWVWVIEFRRVA